MATSKEVTVNGRDTFAGKSPFLKKPTSLVLPKDEHVRKKRKASFEAETKPPENLGKAHRLSSSEESWNITSVSPTSPSPSPTKTANNSLKTTLKKIKKEGTRSINVKYVFVGGIKTFSRRNAAARSKDLQRKQDLFVVPNDASRF